MSLKSICVVVMSLLTFLKSETIPIINISSLFSINIIDRLDVANQIGKACEEVGFFVVTGHNVPENIINNAWKSTRDFFDLDESYKNAYETKNQTKYPFGYCPLGGEVLKLGKSAEQSSKHSLSSSDEKFADLKEMFSLGPSNPLSGFPPREFPDKPVEFEKAWTEYYETMTSLGKTILSAFALTLQLPDERYFDQYLDHHASAIRALNYPELPSNFSPGIGQVRAGAHTDYGAITILRTDGPGLQVSKDAKSDSDVHWIDVPYVQGGFIINLGDLMKRWTSDLWLSTLHRVIIQHSNDDDGNHDDSDDHVCSASTGSSNANDDDDDIQSECEALRRRQSSLARRRQSMAFFLNINRDAVVSALPSVKTSDKHTYDPIVAGDFLLMKHLAAQAKA